MEGPAIYRAGLNVLRDCVPVPFLERGDSCVKLISDPIMRIFLITMPGVKSARAWTHVHMKSFLATRRWAFDVNAVAAHFHCFEQRFHYTDAAQE